MTDDNLFEALYQNAGRDRDRLGWNRSGPNPMLMTWLTAEPRTRGRAMVVACGVGDDAEYLASEGWDVTAFDFSPSAIEWCRERSPDSVVDYRVADLLNLPQQWSGAFDLVLEVFTIQSISPDQTRLVIEAIAALASARGTLLVSTLIREADEPRNGPPWPVPREALMGFSGLDEMSRVEHETPYPGIALLEVEYRRG
ncbi:MAG: class I SAM-dependent methyltransferase [bacterium]|nr:class I SAM-dependent methyltransferase [bacterium]